MTNSETCPHGFAYWQNACLVCTTDPEDAPDVMTPERPPSSPTWSDLTIGNDGVTWWHPGHGIVAVLPPGATSRPPDPAPARNPSLTGGSTRSADKQPAAPAQAGER